MGDSKAVDEFLLGDGFSIVDSTKGDGTGENLDNKKTASKVEIEEQKESSVAIMKEEKKSSAKEEIVETTTVATKLNEEVKDETKLNGHDHSKSDALLITTEEDLDMIEKEKKPEVLDSNKEGDEEVKVKKEPESKENNEKMIEKRKQGDVWVSNITRHVKATDLKKHFNRQGKVLTAKIVTNGKSFFGYILMENSDVANKCVRSLHGSVLDGKKIMVSRQRPDQRRPINSNERKASVGAAAAATAMVVVKSVKNEKKTANNTEEKKSESTKKDDALAESKRNEKKWRKEVDVLRREITRLKRYLSDQQRRLRVEQQKSRSLGRDLQDAELKLREERRKFDREREMFEKNQRTDRIKLENDRTMIKKELEEVKKLREYLKRKMDEEQQHRSAVVVERRPRATSPYAYSSKRFRDGGGGGGEKGDKYVENREHRAPHRSPPSSSTRTRGSPTSVNPYPSGREDKERRGTSSHHYKMEQQRGEEVGRHGGGSSAIVIPGKPSAPAAPRNLWPSFHQEVWRMPPNAATSTPFAPSQSSYQRQSDYNPSSSSSKGGNYSQSRDFGKREHYNSSSARKY